MELSDLQLDALKELINIGVGNGASLLNQILNQPIALSAIHVDVVDIADLNTVANFDKNASTVLMAFEGQLTGKAKLIFPNNDALKLLNLIAPWINIDTSIGQVKKNVLMEVGNIVINGVIGCISNALKITSKYSLPQYWQGDILDLFKNSNSGTVILANTQYEIESHKIKGSLLIFLEVHSFETLSKLLDQSLST